MNADRNFVHTLCGHLRAHHARVVPRSDRLLELQVRAAVARARRRGLTLQPKIAIYVSLMFEIAPDFDDHDEIARVLYRTGSTPDIQIDYLPALIREPDWASAKAGGGPRAWARVLGRA